MKKVLLVCLVTLLGIIALGFAYRFAPLEQFIPTAASSISELPATVTEDYSARVEKMSPEGHLMHTAVRFCARPFYAEYIVSFSWGDGGGATVYDQSGETVRKSSFFSDVSRETVLDTLTRLDRILFPLTCKILDERKNY
jgi:hypothetical protein